MLTRSMLPVSLLILSVLTSHCGKKSNKSADENPERNTTVTPGAGELIIPGAGETATSNNGDKLPDAGKEVQKLSIIGTWNLCKEFEPAAANKLVGTHLKYTQIYEADGTALRIFYLFKDKECTEAYTQDDLMKDKETLGEDLKFTGYFLEEFQAGKVTKEKYVAGKPDANGIGTLDIMPQDASEAPYYILYKITATTLAYSDSCDSDEVAAGSCPAVVGDTAANRGTVFPEGVFLTKQ